MFGTWVGHLMSGGETPGKAGYTVDTSTWNLGITIESIILKEQDILAAFEISQSPVLMVDGATIATTFSRILC